MHHKLFPRQPLRMGALLHQGSSILIRCTSLVFSPPLNASLSTRPMYTIHRLCILGRLSLGP
jgi:hypothetical protein